MHAKIRDRAPLNAAELGWILESCCRLGVRARARGWCIGELEAAEIRIEGDALSIELPTGERGDRRRQARLNRHRASGHDEGCAAVGVPMAALRSIARELGAPDAASYLLEGVEEAVREIGADLTWDRSAAAEAVVYAIRRRITSRPPPETRKAAPLTRSRRGLPRRRAD